MSTHGSVACPACEGAAAGTRAGQTAPAWSTGFGSEWGQAHGLFAPAWGAHFPPSTINRLWMYTHPDIDDDRLGEIVSSTIANDPMIPVQAHIGIEVSDGVVTLTGTVPDKFVKHAAGEDAWYTPGVWDVHNNLNVAALHKTRRRARTTEQVARSASKQV